jgi:glyoxylase-like metal-dependent hydrolase (beta-lactamase superfamily II)
MKVRYIPGVGFDSNVYLLEDEDPIVVDTGTGAYVETVLEEISGIVPLKRIGRIVLTHSHYDHIGGAADFQKATGGKIYLHEEEARRILSDDYSLTLTRKAELDLGKLDIESLKTGQKMKLGASELEVLHTPGHSPGSIVLLDREGKSAAVGDTVFCDGGVGRWDLPGGDLGELQSSLKIIRNLGLKNMYPGHGSYAEGDAPEHLKLATGYLEGVYR